MEDAFLTVADVAEMLTLNQQSVRNLIDRGDLAAFHVGRRARIRRSDLDNFASRQPVEPRVTPSSQPVVPASPEELAARERLVNASRTLARAAKAKTNEPLITAKSGCAPSIRQFDRTVQCAPQTIVRLLRAMASLGPSVMVRSGPTLSLVDVVLDVA